MKIYDEITNEELTSPDLSEGYLYTSRRVIGHTEESYEIMEGTVTEKCPGGLRRLIPAQNIYEDCQFYHTYTAEEIVQRNKPTLQDQISAVEAQATYTAMMTDTLMTEE
jgi:hypothetical protein